MERDYVVSGVHIGEHSFATEQILEEIKHRCVDKGMKFCMIRPPKGEKISDENYIIWAKYLAEHEIYFTFLYATQFAPDGQNSHLHSELVSCIKEIAGSYFMGEVVGECGSLYAAKLKGYYNKAHNKFHPPIPEQNVGTLTKARDSFVNKVKKYVDIDKKNGIKNILCVEPTLLSKYNLDAGVNFPLVETMLGNPEMLFAMARGCTRAKKLPYWGTYVAHEWYGGMRHSDILKQKRLGLLYKYAYIAGSNVMCAESGDELVSAYDQRYEGDDAVCQNYSDNLREITSLIQLDSRPVGGPKVKLAFILGNLDGWSGGVLGSSVWGQHDDPAWANSSAEFSWRILDELGIKRSWKDIENYGDEDLSALPAYGMYDIIPAESDLETMSRYDYLIFVGWNTMTEEIYSNLKRYVENGGILFAGASHLNTSDKRDGETKLIFDGDVSELFGCRLSTPGFSCNDGYKFELESLVRGFMYPGTRRHICDPLFSNGFASYAEVSLCGAVAAARLENTFRSKSEEEYLARPIALTEYRLGKGTSILLSALDYPGHSAVYPVYRMIVREFISLSHRNCEIKVFGNDKVRFSVYEGGVIYLVNTDYDSTGEIIIEYGKTVKNYNLKPGEFKRVEVERLL